MLSSSSKNVVTDIPRLIVVVGETASGKTSAAIKIAKQVNGEIICADSRTVYRYMNIGTAKPNAIEQDGVPHHLIDVVEPGERFSAAQFKALAQKCIREISDRGNTAILVGGTGLYIDAVLYNFQFNKLADDVQRQRLQQMNDEELTTLLHTNNINTDTLNTKNRRHVIRAIERGGEVSNDIVLRKNTLVVGLRLEREVLHQRIESRVRQMMQDGFLDEVQWLADRYGWESEAMSGIGYRVARQYFEGSASLSDVTNSFIKRDISLAKRQRTWFKRSADIEWFDDADILIKRAVDFANMP